MAATAAGYHAHNGVNLDELLDNYDEAELNKIREYLRGFRQRLERNVKAGSSLTRKTGPTSRSLPIICGSGRSSIDTIQNYRHNPTLYVELIGTALFTPMVVEYDNAVTRYRHIVARLNRLPALLGQARQNLESSPKILTFVARGERRVLRSRLQEEVPSDVKANDAPPRQARSASRFWSRGCWRCGKHDDF